MRYPIREDRAADPGKFVVWGIGRSVDDHQVGDQHASKDKASQAAAEFSQTPDFQAGQYRMALVYDDTGMFAYAVEWNPRPATRRPDTY